MVPNNLLNQEILKLEIFRIRNSSNYLITKSVKFLFFFASVKAVLPKVNVEVTEFRIAAEVTEVEGVLASHVIFVVVSKLLVAILILVFLNC